MMNIRRCSIGAVAFLGLVLFALVATSPVQAQESNPEGSVFGCLTDAGYEVLDVYGDEDAGMVLMEIVSDEWDEDLRTQIVWGWYCLYPPYEDSENLVTGLAYEERYILAFFVGRADFGDWLDGDMSDSEFASAYTYGVYDTEIGDWVSETDFLHTYFPGAEPTIEEEGLIPKPGQQPSEPVFSDDFSDDDSGLNPHFEDEEYEVGYVNGEYHINILDRENRLNFQYYPDLELDDFSIQVQARLVAGSDEGNYGLLIRLDPDTREYYMFGISADGYYEIYKHDGDGWTELVGWTRSPDIEGDGEWDLLRVEASGSMMSFLANGEPLATVEDDDFSTGTIALFAGTFDDPAIHVAFDNLTVWTGEAPSEVGGVVTGERSFGPVTWYRYVDEDGQWQDPVTEYPPDTPILIAVFDYENMEDGLEWGNLWLYEGTVLADWSDDYQWEAGQSGTWGSWIYYPDGSPLPSGEYELELYVEGELMQSATTRIR